MPLQKKKKIYLHIILKAEKHELILLDLKSKRHSAFKSSLSFICLCHLVLKEYYNFFCERIPNDWIQFLSCHILSVEF